MHNITSCCILECSETEWAQCTYCNKSYCYSHTQKLIIYDHAVFCWELCNQGRYCQPCDMQLRETGEDRLHRAFLEIQDLRIEYMRLKKLPAYLQTQERQDALQKRKEQAEDITTRNNRFGWYDKISNTWGAEEHKLAVKTADVIV